MLKLLFALGKGQATERVEGFTDKHATTILKQQIRDSAKAVQAAKKSLAIAMAQQRKEEDHLNQLKGKIADLEERTLAALEQGQDSLARQSAETIANLEAEKELSERALSHFQKENGRLKTKVQKAQSALKELERGYRLAEVTDKTQRLRHDNNEVSATSLADAQATLERLQNRQAEQDLADEFLDSFDDDNCADKMVEKLADNGCGTPIKTSADDILERLQKRTKGTS